MKPFDAMKEVVRHFTQIKFTSIFWKWVNRLFVVTCCGWPSVYIRWEHLKNVTFFSCIGSCFCSFLLSQVSVKSFSLYLVLYKHSVAKSSTVWDIYWEGRSLHWINCVLLVCFGLLLFWMIKCECAQSTLKIWEKKYPYFRSFQLPFRFHVYCNSENWLWLAKKKSNLFICMWWCLLVQFSCTIYFLLYIHIFSTVSVVKAKQ